MRRRWLSFGGSLNEASLLAVVSGACGAPLGLVVGRGIMGRGLTMTITAAVEMKRGRRKRKKEKKEKEKRKGEE